MRGLFDAKPPGAEVCALAREGLTQTQPAVGDDADHRLGVHGAPSLKLTRFIAAGIADLGGCRGECVHLLHRPQALRSRRLLRARVAALDTEPQPHVRAALLVVNRVVDHRAHGAQDSGRALRGSALLQQLGLDGQGVLAADLRDRPILKLAAFDLDGQDHPDAPGVLALVRLARGWIVGQRSV
jgi:hypothetical protein